MSDRQLTLAFCLMEYFPFGGQQRDFRKIANYCVERGHRVVALVNTWRDEIPTTFEVVQFGVRASSNHLRLEKFAGAVTAWRRANPVDALIGFQKIPGLDCYFAADPCYRERALRRYGWLAYLQPRFHSLSQLERAVFAEDAGTEILVLTEQSQQLYQRVYGTATERFHLLPPGVSAAFQSPDATTRQHLRAHYGITPEQQLLLMVGSNFLTKGVDRSITALAALPLPLRERSQLWIAGHGKPAPLEALAKRLGVAAQVKFLGGRNDVAQLMQAADLLLQPSRTELAGMSIVEALSSDLPVLASGECGYGFHVAAAGAGIVLEEPFQQDAFNSALLTASAADRQLTWRQAAGAYVARVSLRTLAETASYWITNIAEKRATLNRR